MILLVEKPTTGTRWQAAQRAAARHALALCRSKTAAARWLGVSRAAFHLFCRKHKLASPDYRARLTFPLLLLSALGLVAAPAPPLPPMPVLAPKTKFIPKGVVQKLPPIPNSHGARYTNQLSLMPTQRWVNGWARLNPVYVPHNFRHDPSTGAFSIDWPSREGEVFSLEWTDNGIFYPVETIGAWYGTNRSAHYNIWEATVQPTNKPGMWRVVKL